MMNTKNFFLAAALLMASAAFVACSGSDDSIIDEPQLPAGQTGQAKTYTMTVEASMGGGDEAPTRMLTLNGSTLTAKWLWNDVVKVYIQNTSSDPYTYEEVGTLTASSPSSGGLTATLKGSVTLSENKNLYLYYGTASYDFRNQKGTLSDVDKHYDRAKATISKDDYTLSGSNVVYCGNGVSFENQQAIVKFIFKERTNTPLNIGLLRVSVKNTAPNNANAHIFDVAYDGSTGTHTYLNSFDVKLDKAASEAVIAMPAVDLTGGDLMLECTSASGKDDYYYEKKYDFQHPLSFTKGKYYEVTVKMAEQTYRKPDITWTNPTTAVEPDDGRQYNISTANYDITLSGKSKGYCFEMTNSGTVRLHDLTATSSLPFIIVTENLTLDISGTNSIKCAISESIHANNQLKLSGNGSLTVTGIGIDCCGIFCKNYQNLSNQEGFNQYTTATSVDVSSQLAAPGYKVYRSPRMDIVLSNGQSAYSWTYYVSPVSGSDQTIDLSTLTASTVVPDGATLTGTLGGNYKISIADGATVTLNGVTINGTNNENYNWAGITCEGNAHIFLSGENEVCGFFNEFPGIHVPEGKTLLISGSGKLTASSNGWAAGIGGGYVYASEKPINCGNIVIDGGDITAAGGQFAAGIGSAAEGACGDITIMGGQVTATGGSSGAGIGSGNAGKCGNITISGGTVTATGGSSGAGIGTGHDATCGDITIISGTVEATGGQYAAGIGCGGGNNIVCGDISIIKGNSFVKVKATKGDKEKNGAIWPIGLSSSVASSCGDIYFDGVKVHNHTGATYGLNENNSSNYFNHLTLTISSTDPNSPSLKDIWTLTPND